jgi:hypothetical protein
MNVEGSYRDLQGSGSLQKSGLTLELPCDLVFDLMKMVRRIYRVGWVCEASSSAEDAIIIVRGTLYL